MSALQIKPLWYSSYHKGNDCRQRLEKREFIAFYVKDNRVLAAASSQRNSETAAISELMRLDQMLAAEVLRNGDLDLIRP